ncbi:MAG: hypothetical protein WCR08_10800 [Gammaproteobacteria bacterium]
MPPRIAVETGVEIPDERGHSHSQALDDAIKISIIPDENEPLDVSHCHFLQFITRQAPNMFLANLTEEDAAADFGVQAGVFWETADTHYMDNSNIAKWRVDSNANPSPFYDDGGAHDFKDGVYSMYDQPGYANDFERTIGCTFVIANDQIIGQVLWSRQHIQDGDEYFSGYQYHIDDTVRQLPDWTMYCLSDAYVRNSGPSGNRLSYTTPLHREPIESAPDAQIAMNHELTKLPPPPNWLLLQDPQFSVLMAPPAATTAHAEEEHEEESNSTHIYREASQNLRAQSILQDIQPPASDAKNNASILPSPFQHK